MHIIYILYYTLPSVTKLNISHISDRKAEVFMYKNVPNSNPILPNLHSVSGRGRNGMVLKFHLNFEYSSIIKK